jgi:hypothetical protein
MAQPEHGRRRFFNQLARDLLVGAGEVRGIRHITYGELMSAPDDRLGKVTPGIREKGRSVPCCPTGVKSRSSTRAMSHY